MLKQKKLKIEKIANEVYQRCLKNQYGINNIFDSLKLLDRKIELIRYPADENLLGFIRYKKEDEVYIIYSNPNQVLSREIFTVAHEIGHCYLNHLAQKQFYNDYAKGKDDSLEIEANYFAACLLLPKDILKEYLLENRIDVPFSKQDIACIMKEFNCSFECVINRLNTLNYISSEFRDDLIINKAQISIERLLKSIDGPASLCQKSNDHITFPNYYLKWIIYNYNQRLISKEKLDLALKYMNISYDDIKDQISFKNEKIIEFEDYFNE